MSVVFDEVVGNVESEAQDEKRESASEPQSKQTGFEKTRRAIRLLQQREARLKAD